MHNDPANDIRAEPAVEPAARVTEGEATERTEVVRRLFQEHNRALVRFLTARLHCEQEARDVAQEAYVRLLQLEDPGALSFLRAYLFKIAANLAIDRVRQCSVRNHVGEEVLFEEIEEPLVPERLLLAEQELESVGRRLNGLPPRCRHAFVMHVLLDRPVREIAVELGVTERMVQNYIVRGLMLCRDLRHGPAREKENK